MALSDVIKKKEATGEAKAQNSEKKNLLEDVRVVIAILIVLIFALIGLIVYGTLGINETKVQIDEMKIKYSENQQAIAQLVALQQQSEMYKARKAEYDSMISSDPIDQMNIMINMENEVEKYNCSLTGLDFDEITNTGLVNQINVYMTVTGKYEDIIRFCRDTVNKKQIKRIDKINMTILNKDDNTMNAEITVVEFSKG